MSDAQHEDILNQLKEPEMAERLRRKRRFAETMAEVTGLQDDLGQTSKRKGGDKCAAGQATVATSL